MQILKSLILSVCFLFLSACGSGETQIDSRRVFDLWSYMTSSSNYEVTYDVYENGINTGSYLETHRQFGDQYREQSASGTTNLFLTSNTILMSEPTGNIDIIRYVYLGDRGVFQSSSIQLCSFERFYDSFTIKNSIFYNVIQITCTNIDGSYQEFYYGYDEGFVAMYKKVGTLEIENVKVSERVIL